MLVWDDELEVDDGNPTESFNGPLTASASVQIRDLPTSPRMKRRSHSIGPSDFPPPIRRSATDTSGLPRPVSFASKFPRINPGASGVAVLEHMERLDAVEASLQRLGDDAVIEEADEEDERGDIGNSPSVQPPQPEEDDAAPDAPIRQPDEMQQELDEVDESDITFQGHDAMAASMPHIGTRVSFSRARTSGEYQSPQTSTSRQNLDWINADKKRTVVVEVRFILSTLPIPF
jgi:phosphatidylinositol 4-kinase type 2